MKTMNEKDLFDFCRSIGQRADDLFTFKELKSNDGSLVVRIDADTKSFMKIGKTSGMVTFHPTILDYGTLFISWTLLWGYLRHNMQTNSEADMRTIEIMAKYMPVFGDHLTFDVMNFFDKFKSPELKKENNERLTLIAQQFFH
jgi:hypothetical protein